MKNPPPKTIEGGEIMLYGLPSIATLFENNYSNNGDNNVH